jgi:hypothetical protein
MPPLDRGSCAPKGQKGLAQGFNPGYPRQAKMRPESGARMKGRAPMISIRYGARYSSALSGHVALNLPNPGLKPGQNPGLSSGAPSGETPDRAGAARGVPCLTVAAPRNHLAISSAPSRSLEAFESIRWRDSRECSTEVIF